MYGAFEYHEMPSGDSCYYRDSDHSYWNEIQQKGEKWSGIKAERLTSPSQVSKILDVSLADKLLGAAERDGPEWFERKNKRAKEGTNVHKKVLEALAEGERIPLLSDLEPEERGYAQGVLAWWSDRDPTPISSEQVVLSTTQGYAGRVDLVAEIDGLTTIVDLKTGFVGESSHAQLAGYELAADESGLGPIQRCAILKVHSDGSWNEYEGLATGEQFKLAMQIYRHSKALSAAVKAQMKEGA